MMRWELEPVRGTVRALHERSAALVSGPAGPGAAGSGPAGSGPLHRRALAHYPADAALVLGSTQPEATVDRLACAAAGVEVVRRRSGGGAVLVEPGSLLWVDIVLPAGDPLWSDDVGRAAWWVGEVWAQALAGSGLGPLGVWRQPMRKNKWSSLVCFAGVGPGEVIGPAGSKVVGISQRRARRGALYQCACLLSWEPARLLKLLALTPEQAEPAWGELAAVATGIGAGRAESVLEHLGRALAKC